MANLDTKIENLRKKLRSSKTAVSAGAKPTKRDIETEKALRTAESQKSRKLGEAKKGKEERGEEASKPSTFNRVLNFLNAPVALGAGAVESALGQGTEEGLLENMRANMREGGTYGDVIRQGGASNWLAMPIGFALDVALDPVNWATAGTAAIVPRIGKGAVKGGLKGAKVAAKYAASEKIDNMLGAVSEKYRRNVWDNSPIRGRFGNVMEKVATSSKKNSKEYAELVEGGSSALERLTKEQQTHVDKFISGVGDALNKARPGTTKWLKKHFWGDDPGWIKESKLAEDLRNAPDGPYIDKARIHKQRAIAASGFEEGDMLIKNEIPSRSASSADNQAKMATAMADDMEDGIAFQARLEAHIEKYLDKAPEKAKKLRALGADDSRLAKKVSKDLGRDATREEVIREAQEDYLSTFSSIKADVEGYDRAVAKALLGGTAQKFFKGHARLMGAFKANVIGLSIPARVNQAIGNFVAFVPISGINPFTTGFARSLSRAAKFSYTQNLKHLKEMLTDEDMLKLMKEYPDTFTKVMGIKAEFLTEGAEYINRRIAQLAKQGNVDQKVLDRMYALRSEFEEGVFNAAKAEGFLKGVEAEALETYKKIGKKARKEAVAPFQSVTQFDTSLGNTNLTQEFVVGQVSKWHKELAKKAAKGDKGAEVMHWILTKPLEDYGRGDQIFKLGVMMHTTRNGISQAEMKALQKWYKFKPGDIIESKNGMRFKLTPEASMDVANSMFLNYSAMPSWSKVARSLPLVGAPFASFAAGAQKNVLKGIGYNLSYFNKARNLIHEVSGEKGPMEREALESPYYDHITSNPAMIKLPFFKENPVYLNLGNALHVFDSNLLDDPARDYESKYGKEFVSLIDKSPFLKDPTGQFMLNYAVLPYLLGEAIGPFNNELYSEDDTTGQKIGKTITGAVEPFVPKSPGTAMAALPVSEEALPYVPSYGARRFKNATLGKGPTGRNSSESAESKTIRAGFAEVGLPVYRVNTNTSKK